MIEEHDPIVLTSDLPEYELKAGTRGTVVHIFPSAEAYLVEFFSPAGNTTAVAYAERAQVRLATPDEVEPLTVLYNWVQDGIAVLTLTNPKKRNVLSSRTLAALEEWLDWIANDPDARVVVIRSEGPVFSSGHDLNELVNGDAEEYTAVFDACTRVMEGIRLLPKPVIAQVQGLATAAGCQLVATCDIAVAADTAAFATPGVQIGLFCTTPGVAVSRSVMPKKAMEMLLTGRPISAQEALEFGLISRIAPAEELEEQVMDLARQIASASAQTLALGKAAFYKQIEMDRPSAYQFAGKVMVDNLLEDDAHEGITAFLEKRPPIWTT
ncbi:MAG: enoyl-CoA hydratase [Chloroflexi bacterium]|nr:enoyl-CoA hydratase [Chloroflexota bacterium]